MFPMSLALTLTLTLTLIRALALALAMMLVPAASLFGFRLCPAAFCCTN